MSETTARTAVYNAVNGVTNVGNVYDYDRWAALKKGVDTLVTKSIGGSTLVRFWTVSCRRIAQEHTQFFTSGTSGILRRYTYIVRGAFGVDDSAGTEKTAIGIVEDVLEAMDNAATLHDGSSFYNAEAAQLDTFELRIVGEYLCHYAEITQVVEEMMT
jgi:hypothetical protein